VPLIALGGAITGACTALAFQTFMNTYDYPINVGVPV
jgi:hypothetical protein